MITVLLVDDHDPVRKGLKYFLETTADIQVIATASNGSEAVNYANSFRPDVIVMDVSMPFMDGIEATRQICQRSPLARVIMLSVFVDREYIYRALQVGAKGYVLKDTMGEDLPQAIRTIHDGKHYFSQHIAVIAATFLPPSEVDSWAA